MASSNPEFLRLMHYSTPLATVFFAVTLALVSACIVRPSNRSILSPSQRYISNRIALVIVTLYLGEGLVYVLRACLQENNSIGQDDIVYITLSVLIWYGFCLFLDDAASVHWLPTLGSWIFATALETFGCFLTLCAPSTKDHLSRTQLGLQIIRVSCLIGICSSIAVPASLVTECDIERRPLLESGEDSPIGGAEYGSVQKTSAMADEETDVTDGNDQLRREQRQRLNALGGWWGYLRKFLKFLPFIIPTKSPRHQGYAVTVALLILSDRFTNLIGPRLLGNIVQDVADTNDKDGIPWRQVVFFIVVIKIPHDHILVPLRSVCSTRLYYHSYRVLMLSSFSHIMGLSLEFHENKSTGDVETTMRQGELLTHIFDDLMNNTVPLLLDVGLAFVYLSWLFSLSLGVVLAVVYVTWVVATYKVTAWGTTRRRQYLKTQIEEQTLIHQSISNWQAAAYFNRQDYLQRRMEDVVEREVHEMAQFNDLAQVKNIAQGLVMTLGYGAVLLLAEHQVVHQKQPISNMVTLLLYWGIITRPLNGLAASYKTFVNYLVDSERLLKLMELTATVTDADDARDLEFRGGKVEYRNVHFSYDKGSPLIKNLNFIIEPGSTVAFVGATGSGKTTTCDKLLFRLYDVTEGSILIDGQDIRDITQFSLRETMGIVRQDQTFYNETIMENVRFARLDATDEEVFEACKNAVIHNKILGFPNGYNSKIGERGVKLSGGEKQRLFIAQLFLRDPKIVVLDEATSTVDNITEAEIQDSFARICKGRTTVIIAHRLSTIKDADQIFVLDQGQIVERGTHDKLLGQKGHYHDLWYTRRTADKLQEVLTRACFFTAEAANSSSSTTSAFINHTDSPEIDSLSTTPDDDILQADGSAASKQMQGSNPAHISFRKKMHDVKQRFRPRKLRPEDMLDTEAKDSDGNEDKPPFTPISPKPTKATLAHPPARKPFPRRGRSRETAMPVDNAAKWQGHEQGQEQGQRHLRCEPMSSGTSVSMPPGLPAQTTTRRENKRTAEPDLGSPQRAALESLLVARHDEEDENAGAGTTIRSET